MTSERVRQLVARLAADPERYPAPTPHPRAQSLSRPDGRPAPASIRAWAAFDDHCFEE
ncbi:MAG: hypothetical protein KC619_02945 [Myxococcales bacterium]|nr:hypothetical protein [Myxococcales bacterium]